MSLVLGGVFERADGHISGTSVGAGAVVFGACGALVTVNGLPAGARSAHDGADATL